MSTSNFPGYMEIKVEKFDGDTGTGEFNLSYDEIEKYFLIGDGQVILRVPNDFVMAAGARLSVLDVYSNTIDIGELSSPTSIYMTGGTSKAFSLTEPTP